MYITNIVKCRPPQNRDPLPQEQEACIGYLRNQFALLRPKILVCLGRIAGQKLIKPDLKITKEHGIFFDKGGTLMMATLHPAALLRNPAQKPAAFEDYLKLREKIDELGCDVAQSAVTLGRRYRCFPDIKSPETKTRTFQNESVRVFLCFESFHENKFSTFRRMLSLGNMGILFRQSCRGLPHLLPAVEELVDHHHQRPGDDHQVVGEKAPDHHSGIEGRR